MKNRAKKFGGFRVLATVLLILAISVGGWFLYRYINRPLPEVRDMHVEYSNMQDSISEMKCIIDEKQADIIRYTRIIKNTTNHVDGKKRIAELLINHIDSLNRQIDEINNQKINIKDLDPYELHDYWVSEYSK